MEEIELALIYPNPAQPRKNFNDIDELAESIKQKGLIQAIAVVKDGAGKYMIIGGERRFRACTLLGLKTIKCHIIDADSKDIEEMSLVENIQRDELTDFEIANHITKLWNSGKYEKKQDLGKVLGKKPAYISKALGLVDKLDESIKEDLKENKSDIGMSVLEEVSRVENHKVQAVLYKMIKKKEITRDHIKIKRYEVEKNLQKSGELPVSLSFEFNASTWTEKGLEILDQGWIFEQLDKNVHYKCNIKEVHPLSEAAKENIGTTKIEFTIKTTEEQKKALKGTTWDVFSKVMQVGRFYKFTITTTHKQIISGFRDISKKEKETTIKYSELTVKEKENHAEKKGLIYNKKRNWFEIPEDEVAEEPLINSYLLQIVDEDYRIYVDEIIQAANENKALTLAYKKYPTEAQDDDFKFNIYFEPTLSHKRKEETFPGETSINKKVAYGFGTVNDTGTYVAVVDGDFKGTFTFEEGGELMKTTNNREYKITIEYVGDKTEKKDKEKILIHENQTNIEDFIEEPKEIKLIEVFEKSIYIEYADFDSDEFSHSKARDIIKSSTTEAIKFTIHGGSEKAHNFINKMPHRTQRLGELVLKEEKKKR